MRQPSTLRTNNLIKQTNPTAKRIQTQAKAKGDLREQALTSMPAFAELIGFHGGWSSFSKCHEELVEFLSKPQLDVEAQSKLRYLGDEKSAHLRRLVLMPRGHLKSTLGTTLYVMWRIYRNPEIRIFVGSNKQSLSFSFIRELRTYFESEELQKKVWNNRPHIEGALIPELNTRSKSRNRNRDFEDTDASDRKLIWNNNALQVNRVGRFKEPTVFAGSVGASITGQHYDLVILDDLIDFKNTESDVKKERVEEWIQDIESVLNPVSLVKLSTGATDTLGGEIIVSGTRYAVDDYYGFLLENLDDLQYVAHTRNIYKNGTDDSDGYLWEERYNAQVVTALKARTSPRRFASQYLNTVFEKDVALLDVSACTVLPDSAFYTRGNLAFVECEGRVETVRPIICIDPAFSSSKNGDDCAIVVGCKLSNGATVVLDAKVDRLEAAEVVKTTLEFASTYKTLRVYHEQNGVGMLLPELFKNKSATVDGKLLVINSFYEQRPKDGKIQGVLELPFALGAFWFRQTVWNQERLMKQLRNYPAVRHDDFLDALVTLFEKAKPNRTTKQTTTNIIRNFTLNIDQKLEIAVTDNERTLLGDYNAYFK